MHTVLTTSPDVAAAFIRDGEVVAFPTETVYGLGADAFDADAVAKIFDAKGRPADNPLIVHIAGLEQLDAVAEVVTPAAGVLIEHFFPGPLTLILPKRPELPTATTAGLDTVGVRMPRHHVALAFLAASGRPVAAPSANQSGRPSPTTWEAVQTDLDGRIACILQAERTPAGLESTVVDCTETTPVVLRAGVVTVEHLRGAWPDIEVAGPDASRRFRSPGTRHRHYAPHARVRLVAHPSDAAPALDAAYLGLDAPAEPTAFGLVSISRDLDAYAHELYDFFRRCDDAGMAVVYCQTVPPAGLGLALMDRLRRAAHAG